MKDLIKEVRLLKEKIVPVNSGKGVVEECLCDTIECRINELEESGKCGNSRLFNELCFCLLTANFNAEKSIRIQKELGNGFYNLPEEKLVSELKRLGHRFPNARSQYILAARSHRNKLRKIIDDLSSDETALREWFVKNIKGLGYKEASHYLRNIGFKNYAIIDFHIIDILADNGYIARPKTKSLNRKLYLEVEDVLKGIAKKLSLNLSELDFYLWYMETGKVLK